MNPEIESQIDRFPTVQYCQSFSVPFEYPVHFTRDIFHPENPLIESVIMRKGETRRHRVQVYIDDGVLCAMPGIKNRIVSYFDYRAAHIHLTAIPESVPGGEKIKNNWSIVQHIMTAIGNSHLCRQSYVIAIGGGSVLDLVGFAASLIHRGLRLIRVPTTVLAQDDAGVGVKNGMDEHGVKNFIGTFAPPFAVLIDFDFLRTLETKYWTGGIAEAFKVAIIKDAPFFDYLCRHAGQLNAREESVIEYVVQRCAILHLDHIRSNGDPFEFGTARPLDFGHWLAHKLEILSDYQIGHGQAVAIGIAVDSCYAVQTGYLTWDECHRILNAMRETGLPIWHELLDFKLPGEDLEVIRGLDDFREHLGGQLTITLPDHIGQKIEIHEMQPSIIRWAIRYLKEFSSRKSVRMDVP